MGIGITAERAAQYPWPLVISFSCDGEHAGFARPSYTFRGVDFVTAYTDIMAMGWLERRGDHKKDRSFLCPACSGKTPTMNAPARTAKLPPWSYSHLNTFITCNFQYFNRYVAKTTVYRPSVKQDWGNKVHSAFDRRISAGVPLPVDMAKWDKWATPFAHKPVRTELELGIRLNGTVCGMRDQDAWGRCKIDVLVEPGDQTARIFDWKSGKLREDNFELRIQGMFAQAMNPSLRIIYGWYVWLAEGFDGKLGTPHDLTDVERTWAEVTSIYNTMNNNFAINHWPKKPGPLCGYCDVFSCEFNTNKDRG